MKRKKLSKIILFGTAIIAASFMFAVFSFSALRAQDMAPENSAQTEISPEITVNKIPQDIVKKTRSNIQGLDLLSTTAEDNPSDYFFFEKQGEKKEKIELGQLIDQGENQAEFQELEMPDQTIINLESLIVTDKGESLTTKFKDKISDFFKSKQEKKAEKEAEALAPQVEQVEIDITEDGLIAVKNQEDVDSKKEKKQIEIEYEYGVYEQAYQAEEILIDVPDLAVGEVQEDEFEDLMKEIETEDTRYKIQDTNNNQLPITNYQTIKPDAGANPVPDVGAGLVPVPDNVGANPLVRPEDAEVNNQDTSVQDTNNNQIPNFNDQIESSAEIPVPEVLGAKILEPFKESKNIIDKAIDFIKGLLPGDEKSKFFGRTRRFAPTKLSIAQAAEGVKAYQVKMKAATEKGEQTFQVLPDGSVYLYDGTELAATSKSIFQYQDASGDWLNFNLTEIKQAKKLEDQKMTILIKQETAEGSVIILKYEFGFDGKQYLKKQSWSVKTDNVVRAVWRIQNSKFKIQNYNSKLKILDEQKSLQIEDLILDISDYQGANRTEVDEENNQINVYFENLKADDVGAGLVPVPDNSGAIRPEDAGANNQNTDAGVNNQDTSVQDTNNNQLPITNDQTDESAPAVEESPAEILPAPIEELTPPVEEIPAESQAKAKTKEISQSETSLLRRAAGSNRMAFASHQLDINQRPAPAGDTLQILRENNYNKNNNSLQEQGVIINDVSRHTVPLLISSYLQYSTVKNLVKRIANFGRGLIPNYLQYNKSSNLINTVLAQSNNQFQTYTIDPSFSLITADNYIEIATPDFQNPESQNGWKLRFNKLKGGAIDQFYHNKIENGAKNLISENSGLFEVKYSGDSVLNHTADLELLESSATRIRIKAASQVNGDPAELIYTVYLSGKINIETNLDLQNTDLNNQDGVFSLNLCDGILTCEPSINANDKLGQIEISGGPTIGIAPSETNQIGAVESQEEEEGTAVNFGTERSDWSQGQTVSTHWLLDLNISEAAEMAGIEKIASDFRNPDTLDFTVGQSDGGYQLADGAYRMQAVSNKVEFTIHGAEVNRYNPVFSISNWNIPSLAKVYTEVAGTEIKQDVDYIISFKDNKPEDAVLIFQYLGTVSQDLIFYIDPTCTSIAAGNWSATGTWDCGVVPDGDDTAVVQHAVVINQDVTILGITINSGGILNFDTTARTLTVNESGGAATITVGAASGGSGELECRAPTTGVHTIKLNSTTADATVGIDVKSTGILDILGTSAADQDCVITNGGVTLDGTMDGYIYLEDGSLTTIKYAEISYMGASVTATKYGIYAAYTECNNANEGLIVDSSAIHNGYVGIYNNGGDYCIIQNNKIYSNSNDGITLANVANHNLVANNLVYSNGSKGIVDESGNNNTFIGNIVHSNASWNIGMWSSAVSNYIFNNTVNSSGNDNIYLSSNNSNIIKNNLISNTPASYEGIDDDGTSTTISNNYFYNNGTGGTAHCTNSSVACAAGASSGGDSGTPNSTVGTAPYYISTDPTNADFLYLDSNETVANGPLGIGLELWGASPTVPGYINVGARLDYVKNDNGGGTAEEFNWMQDAHDDATGQTLGAGDTVTTYAKNYFSDTITSAGAVGSYFVQFNLTSTTNITAANDYEGMYAYFTISANRGKYYLIIDSTDTTDTLTIYSPSDASNTFTAGDGFTVTDRIYTRQLTITKDGTNVSPIIWNTSGTVIFDGRNLINNDIVLSTGLYNIIDGFVITNINPLTNTAGGIFLYNSDNNVIKNNTFANNNGGGAIRFYSSSNNNIVITNTFLSSGGGISFAYTGPNNAVINNTFFNTSFGEIGTSEDNYFIFGNKMLSYPTYIIYTGEADSLTIMNNILVRGNTTGGYYAQIYVAGGNSNLVANNIIVNGGLDGVDLPSGTTNIVRNNILYKNSSVGVDDHGTNTVSYNNYFGNGTACNGTGCTTGQVLTDPNFYFEIGATNITAGTTAYVDLTGTQSWTHNQWVGYGLTFVDGSGTCDSDVKDKWFGIASNSAENLFYVPTPADASTITNCAAKLTNFHLSEDSPALDAGANLITGENGATDYINIGARLGLSVNDQGTPGTTADDNKYNEMQYAHDDASLTAGDTVTVYAKDYTAGEIIATAVDNGPYITITITDGIITADNQYEGMYAYFSDGRKKGNYYLIMDSDENGATDTISLYTDSITDFNIGDDFTIVDRVYAREGESTDAACTSTTENLCLTKDGNSNGASPITWTASGSVIIDAGDVRSYGIYANDSDHNILNGFIVTNALVDNIYLTASGNTKLNSNTLFSAAGDGVELAGISANNILDSNTSLANAQYGFNLNSGTGNLLKANTAYSNTLDGISITTASNVLKQNQLYSNSSYGIEINQATNTLDGNVVFNSTQAGIYFQDNGDNSTAYNNLSVNNTTDGIYLTSGTSGNTIYNNILSYNTDDGLDEDANNTDNYNAYYLNGTKYEGIGQGANEVLTDPAFYAYNTPTYSSGGASASSTIILTTSGWTADQYRGYVLWASKTGANYFRYILSHTATASNVSTVVIAGTWPAAMDGTYTYKVIDFTLDSIAYGDSTNAQGGGAYLYAGDSITAGTKPATESISMGAFPDYVYNTNGGSAREMSNFQIAQADGNTGAGDTLTAYAAQYRATATIKTTGGVADNGPYLTLTLNEDVISADDDYIGFYYYVTTGDNAGNAYLIIDSATAAGPADTISIYTAQDNNFASDVGKIIDRVYDHKGYDNGTVSANVRFTKDGSAGSPIIWNASGPVVFDAKNTYTSVFYLDANTGTDGLKYNNFQTNGIFYFVNVPNSSNLYQSGIKINTAGGIVHQYVNWGGADNLANTIFTGTYTSKIIDMQDVDPVYNSLIWDESNVTANLSDITIQLRSNDSQINILTANFLGPDGATGTSYTANTGESISSALNGGQYVQYQTNFKTASTDTLPTMNSIVISQAANLTSSWYNTQTAETLFNNITWTESDGAGGAVPAGADVKIQARTAPDNGSGAPNTASATVWCGDSGCDGASFFTEPAGNTAWFDAILTDASNDQWLQYKITFTQTTSQGKPYIERVGLQYVINTAPTIAVSSASQGSNGAVSIAYTISDAEEAGEDGLATVGLYYSRSATLSSGINSVVTTIPVSNGALFPTAGVIIIDNEIITYTGKSINNLTGATRQAESTRAASHSSGAAVWIKAVTVAGDTGVITGVNAAAAVKAITWTAKTDADGVYNGSFQIKVVAHDGNAANQIGAGNSAAFEFDTADPTNCALMLDASQDVVLRASLTLSATDNTMSAGLSGSMKISNNSDLSADGLNTDSGNWLVYNTVYNNWILASNPEIIYTQFKDSKNNTCAIISGTTPETPTYLAVIDTSNVNINDYRMFVSWKVADVASPAFARYYIYRKNTSGGAYSNISGESLNNRLLNYYTDTNVVFNTNYDYYAVMKDANGNISERSNICSPANPNGASGGCEGGGGDAGLDTVTPVIIYNEQTGEGTPSNSRIIITFQAYDNQGQIRDANIDYDTNIADLSYEFSQGIPTLIAATQAAPVTRAVELKGLSGATAYYYRISVRDAAGNLATNDNAGAGFSFTTSGDPGPIISNVQAQALADSATITWTTDKLSSSQVEYSLNANLASSTNYPADPTDLVTNHEIQITGLASATTYYYKVKSVDQNNNSAESVIYNFSTADSIAPTISQIASQAVTHNSATISFTTSEPATSRADYGPNLSYGSSSINNNYNTSHIYLLTGLLPQTTYYYKITATDSFNNSSVSDNAGAGYSFTTTAEAPPIITNVQSAILTATSARITWTTDKLSSSQVEYSTDAGLAGSTNYPVPAVGSTLSHLVDLTGLTSQTTYYYKVKSVDGAGGAAESVIYNFTAGDAAAPVISAVAVQSTSHNSATITFATNEPARSGLNYGLNTNYGAALTNTNYNTTHIFTLSGLSVSTAYYFKVSATDSASNSSENDNAGAGYTFTTQAAPEATISDVQATLVSSTATTITWTTAQAASSQVEYSTNANLSSSTSYPTSPSDSVTSHSVALTGLLESTRYYYRVKSGAAQSPIYNFLTGDTAAPVISSISALTTESQAVITWTTDEPATSQVDYDTTVNYGSSTTLDSTLTTAHAVALTGLSAGATYYFKVKSQDNYAQANQATSSFLTNPATNISDVAVNLTAPTVARITWTTSQALSSQITYSTNANLTNTVSYPTSPSDSVANHSVSLSGLLESTRYYFRVISGALQSAVYNFLTGDTAAPAISNAQALASESSAVITWTTNEPATTQVEYGLSEAYGASTVENQIMTATHAVALSNLASGTTYYFKVKSDDEVGNSSVASTNSSGALLKFTTNVGQGPPQQADTGAPIISNISVVYTDTSAIVAWKTDELANSTVSYGLTASYGSTVADPVLTMQHSIQLTGLSASSTYHYRLSSEDNDSNQANSADQVFTTNAGRYQYETQSTGGGGGVIIIDKNDKIPAEISKFAISDIAEQSAQISWQTNEPAITLLGLGLGKINDISGDKSSIKNRKTNHKIELKNLISGTVYNVQPIAVDDGGNVTQGSIVEFTTLGLKPIIKKEVKEEIKEEKDQQTEMKEFVEAIKEEASPEVNEEAKIILSEEFEKFIEKLEVYLGPPIIMGLTVSEITDSSALISWQTTVPAASIIDYGLTETYGSSQRLLQFDQKHQIRLSALQENTVYHYRVKSITESGQLVSTQDLVFRTTEVAKVSNFTVNDIREHSAVVSWDSNTPTTSEVEYGIADKDALQNYGVDKLSAAHRLLLTGLEERVRYRVKVVSRDIVSNIITSEFKEFTTSIDDQPPLIKDLNAEGLLTKRDSVQVFISWQTDEPATSLVYYDVGVERDRQLSKQSQKDDNLTTNHIVILSDFAPGSLYQLRAESQDRTGNKSVSEDYSILTPQKDENIIDIIVEEFQDAFGFLKR